MRYFPAIALGVLAIGVWLATSRAAADIVGPAKVVDGDSLEIGSTRIRLNAIDAFEGTQTCGAERWACGAAAAAKLRELIGGDSISCRPVDTDDYGRTVALCRRGAVDLGEAMVASGLAFAYRRYGDRYVAAEDAARAARRGAWQGGFEKPEAFRNEARARPTAQSPSQPRSDRSPAPGFGHRNGCDIKGNLNDRGERIYHVPGSRDYEATRIDESRGERWFCSEADARAAGWRAPRGR
jgi:endonuclease YncB( thermonuclease family)